MNLGCLHFFVSTKSTAISHAKHRQSLCRVGCEKLTLSKRSSVLRTCAVTAGTGRRTILTVLRNNRFLDNKKSRAHNACALDFYIYLNKEKVDWNFLCAGTFCILFSHEKYVIERQQEE